MPSSHSCRHAHRGRASISIIILIQQPRWLLTPKLHLAPRQHWWLTGTMPLCLCAQCLNAQVQNLQVQCLNAHVENDPSASLANPPLLALSLLSPPSLPRFLSRRHAHTGGRRGRRRLLDTTLQILGARCLRHLLPFECGALMRCSSCQPSVNA